MSSNPDRKLDEETICVHAVVALIKVIEVSALTFCITSIKWRAIDARTTPLNNKDEETLPLRPL